MKIKDIVRFKLASQGLFLKNNNEIVNVLTGITVAFLGNCRWLKKDREIEMTVKLNTPINFINIGINMKDLKKCE